MKVSDRSGALARLAAFDRVPLVGGPTPVEEMPRLRAELGQGPRLLVKRDDAIPFAFGGNKTRKLEFVAADARAAGADTLITVGGVQSNHARATAATAARLGMRCHLIINGVQPDHPRANALLDAMLGATIEYIPSRNERAAAMRSADDRLRREGRTPYVVPLGASTPLGSLGFARAVGELLAQIEAPDVIVHAASSAGTHAGLVAGCALHGARTSVIGVSADDPASEVEAHAREIIAGIYAALGAPADTGADVKIDDTFVGEGYGIASPASQEAQRLAARTEAIFVDQTYTAKALAALIAYDRGGRFAGSKTVLFWHTGGQVGLFA
jgi:1-aminocyclopropane-1-carboxylate deaminase/D-cysteine desulfhydrase-like pyridoxal-dependent ACC family enzyme